MTELRPDDDPPIPLFPWRLRDQTLLAVIALGALALLLGFYVWRMFGDAGWLNLDRAEPANNKIIVNINTAQGAELMLLPEIGKITAQTILDERTAHGPFKNGADFQARIKGIGEKNFAKLESYLTGWTENTPPAPQP